MPGSSTDRPPPRAILLESTPTGGADDPAPRSTPSKPAEGSKSPKGPVRRGRFLDRFALNPAPRARTSGRPADSIRVEPKSDPAADEALKKRVEAQVALAVGDKAEEVEVRVVDRSITIRARVARFWNRRAVRRSLESLPALRGYKAKVEVDG